jgi:hypothetical protein
MEMKKKEPFQLTWLNLDRLSAIDNNFCENQGRNSVRDHFEQDERKGKVTE